MLASGVIGLGLRRLAVPFWAGRGAVESMLSVPSVGASGAVCSLVAAFCIMFPTTPMMFMFIPYPIEAETLLKCVVAFDALGTVYSMFRFSPLGWFGLAQFTQNLKKMV